MLGKIVASTQNRTENLFITSEARDHCAIEADGFSMVKS